MKFHNVVAIFTSFYAIIVVNHIAITKAEETTTEKKIDIKRPMLSYCEKISRGRYLKGESYTCCRNSTLYHPHLPDMFYYKYEDHYKKCTLEMSKIDTDDLPTAMWREYICVAKIKGIDDESLKTFRGYLNFITRNYTEPYKSEIENAAVGKCNDADAEKDEAKRAEMFQRCLHRIERKVCHIPPANNKDSPGSYKPKQYCTPEEDFPPETKSCCKGKALPYSSFVDRRKVLEMNPNYTYVENCEEQFINRQKELNPNLYTFRELSKANLTFDRTKLLEDCYYACRVNGIPNKWTELKIEIEMLRSKMFKTFPKSTRIDLLKLMDKYMNENYIRTYNSTVSITEAVKSMDSMEELPRISLYCRVMDYITVIVLNDSIKEYCHDEKISIRK